MPERRSCNINALYVKLKLLAGERETKAEAEMNMAHLTGRPQKLPIAYYSAPVLSGLALILAFPPFEQGYLAWLLLTPFFWFCLKAAPRQALLGGFLFSLPLHLYLNLYLSGVLLTYLPAPLAVLAMALLLLIIAAFYALFAFTAASFARSRLQVFYMIFVLPALWLLMEYARSVGFTGYNVGYLGYTQWRYPLILNLAAVYGYWGLPFIMAAIQALLVLGFLRPASRKALAAATASVAMLLLLGITLPAAFPEEGKGERLQVALIQGNSTPEEILSGSGKEEILNRYLEMTRQAAEAKPELQLAVWPETVVDLQVRERPSHRPAMQSLAEELDIDILYGARLKDAENLFNAVVLLSPGEANFQSYYKQRLVPFVETVPFEEQFNQLLNLNMRLGSYTAGKEKNLFKIRGIPLAAVICFESYFGSYTRHFSRAGGRHLFILTNNVWFGETIGLEQHVQAAAIRAAEMGTGVTQVANSGITASFDYRGREIFRSGKLEAEIFILPLELTRRNTLYTQAGDYFPAFWLAFLAAAALSAALKKRKASRKAKTS